MNLRRRIAALGLRTNARPRLQQGFKTSEVGFRSFCAAAILRRACPLWVISVISNRGTDVRFIPESGHGADTPRCRLCAISDQSAAQQKARDRREWWLRRHSAALRGPACPRRTESRLGISLIRAQLMYCGSCHLDKMDWIVRPSHRERGTDTRHLILRGM